MKIKRLFLLTPYKARINKLTSDIPKNLILMFGVKLLLLQNMLKPEENHVF